MKANQRQSHETGVSTDRDISELPDWVPAATVLLALNERGGDA